jgi:hypothetical protein
MWVGRRPWTWATVAGAAVLGGLGFVVHAQLEREAAEGWRLMRIGEYSDAGARFARARWWPGLDARGAEMARLGDMLLRLGDEKVRREFDLALAALDSAAPGSAFIAYFQGVARFDDFRLGGGDAAKAAQLFSEMQRLFREAAQRDPALAEAHAGLAMAANLECRLDDALAAIGEAERAAGVPTPGRYAVRKAEILSRFGDADRRAAAQQIFETRGDLALAPFLQAMLAWQSGQWARSRDKLAGALAALDQSDDGRAWLMHLPGSPWLLGKDKEGDARRCLVRYAQSLAGRLSGGANDLDAWNGVAQACPRITEDAREYLCVQLPDDPAAAPVRNDLRCPAPQPRAECPAPNANTDVRPAAMPRT